LYLIIFNFQLFFKILILSRLIRNMPKVTRTRRGGAAALATKPATKPKAGAAAKPKAAATSRSDAAEEPRPWTWLMKSEPEPRLVGGVDVKFSFDDLMAEPDRTSMWDGVRNYKARNFMRDDMRIGDRVLFYHSNTKIPGVVGIARVARESYPDHTAFDKKDPHFDPKSDPAEPRWMMVDIQGVRPLNRLVSLFEMRADPALANMMLFKEGRLSVSRVRGTEFDHIVALGAGDAAPVAKGK
jgi:predicted RNA-binding protein with PUA-like domain